MDVRLILCAKIVQGESKEKENESFIFSLPSRSLSWRSKCTSNDDLINKSQTESENHP